MKLVSIFVLFISISLSAQTKTPLFTKWEIYKGTDRLTLGSSGDAVPGNLNIDLSENFKEIILEIVYPEFPDKKITHKLDFVSIDSAEVIKTKKFKCDFNSRLQIKKNLLFRLRKKCDNKKIAMIYGNDSISPAFIIMIEFKE